MTSEGGKYGAGTVFKFNEETDLEIIHSFNFIQGSSPYDNELCEDTNGLIYGTVNGGATNDGLIFRFDPSNNSYITILEFNGEETGSRPEGRLLLADNGKLYGATRNGGSNDDGVLFEINVENLEYKKIIDFSASVSGRYPNGSLIQASDGIIYGTTRSGGGNGGGVIFSYDFDSFQVLDGFYESETGISPDGGLFEASSGKLYGVSYNGGVNNEGALFEYNIEEASLSATYSFEGSNKGSSPSGGVIQGFNDKLYGLTRYGGASDAGILYEFDINSELLIKRVDLFSNSSSLPGTLTLGNDGKLYSFINRGGGRLFEYDIERNQYIELNDLDDVNTRYGDYMSKGSNLMMSSSGDLYGMTNDGGFVNKGMLFAYNLEEDLIVEKFSFGAPDHMGGHPYGSLTQNSEGRIFGLTRNGGIDNAGVIFEYSLFENKYNKITDIGKNKNGYWPESGLTQANNRRLYGIGSVGGCGSEGIGAILELNPSTNKISILHEFKNDLDNGRVGKGDLIEVNNNLYGFTIYGGAFDMGVFFEYNIESKDFLIIKSFDGAVNGKFPNGSLLYSSEGKLYGTTQEGGYYNDGILFEYDIELGLFLKLKDFDVTESGRNPTGYLLEYPEGTLLGLSTNGGKGFFGSLFEYDIESAELRGIYDFTTSDGSFPKGGLYEFNGQLYGLTSEGGSEDLGVIFSFDYADKKYTKKYDFDNDTGFKPINTSLTGIWYKEKQDISLVIEDQIYGNPSFELSAITNNENEVEYFSSNNDLLSIEGNLGTINQAGTVTVSAVQHENDQYFEGFSEKEISIKKTPLLVQVRDAQRHYGETNDNFILDYTGFKYDDNEDSLQKKPVFITDATLTSNVGEYEIYANMILDQNYEIELREGLMTIIKANMMAYVDDQTITEGDQIPDFEIKYEGFLNDDDVMDLDNPPSANTTADESSRAGEYDIILSSGSDNNYSISVENGKLIIEGVKGEENEDEEDVILDIINYSESHENIYPNPVVDRFQFTDSTIEEALLFSLNGKRIKALVSKNKEFNVSELAPGTYIIVAKGLTQNHISRLIKK
ncbi:choice-of-anchor tandem repeat GloVer-containing protein [Reichenbachiella sp.]|uniref:choice-of-anchor tandem repeat GloVer-containing protein n=1 Tax=Reichenbachiella sp. TaxID=2184521 RepID=UPI0032971313